MQFATSEELPFAVEAQHPGSGTDRISVVVERRHQWLEPPRLDSRVVVQERDELGIERRSRSIVAGCTSQVLLESQYVDAWIAVVTELDRTVVGSIVG